MVLQDVENLAPTKIPSPTRSHPISSSMIIMCTSINSTIHAIRSRIETILHSATLPTRAMRFWRIQAILYAASCIEGVLVTAFASSSSGVVVPRITLDEFISSPIRDEPIIIRDIASPEHIEALADELMSLLGDEQIQMQHKVKHDDNGETTTDIYDISLHESIDYMMDSKRNDSFFAFCEGLLPSDATVKLHQKLTEIREAPFPNEENWFNYFPEKVRPTDALILAGEGAVSTLHRDPFEWTGTSLCLEGVKVWRFILPTGGVTDVDEALKSYRLDSIAWEEATEEKQQTTDPLILSAGWQSNMNLYDSIDEEFPTAIDWATLEEENYKLFQKEIISLGSDASLLRPSSEASDALKSISGNNIPFVTATQFAGDLLLIPAHCWHQTYAPTPSIAVASQRCGVSDGTKVVQHVLNLNDRSNPLPDLLQRNNVYEEEIGKEVTAELLRYVLGNNIADNKT